MHQSSEINATIEMCFLFNLMQKAFNVIPQANGECRKRRRMSNVMNGNSKVKCPSARELDISENSSTVGNVADCAQYFALARVKRKHTKLKLNNDFNV